MNNFEILAPIGSKESMAATVLAKADAAYFGFKSGNARARADNFSDLEVLKAIAFLRKNNIKSYITLNTVVFENELSQLEKKLKTLALCPPDAIIFQDLAVLELGRQILENIEFHASTQMGICNLDGLKIMEKLKVNRAVLARELTFEEIKALKNKTKVSLEAFVFGAMCYSASGFCYASLLKDKRSGNRGVCSQICRTKFDNITPFSMKDLDLTEEAEKLIKAGIESLKIEGRMKGADYVYLATKSLKILKDGNFSKESKNECKKLISSILMREKGKGYFYGLDTDIFTKEKHSLQKQIGNVNQLKGNKLTLNNKQTLPLGSRIKINQNGATVIGVENNTIILSANLKGKKGDKVELFPNKTSVKGIIGQVNTFKNTKIPVSITANAKINENLLVLSVYFQNKLFLEKNYDIETILSKDKGLTKEVFLKKTSSPHYTITNFSINSNNYSIKPQVFKQIKKDLTVLFENKENLINAIKCNLHQKYKEINYVENILNVTELPPVYYSKLNIPLNSKVVINNIGQLNYKNKQKISGKFLPITNKVAAYMLKQLGVNTFLIPYELKQDQTTPYFVARKLPKIVPKNFSVKEINDIFLIYQH